MPSHHGDGHSITCVECEQEESCHWLRVEAPAADKMAMLQRTKVFCTKGRHNTELCPRSKDRVSALLTLTFDTLHRLYVGSLISKGSYAWFKGHIGKRG